MRILSGFSNRRQLGKGFRPAGGKSRLLTTFNAIIALWFVGMAVAYGAIIITLIIKGL